MKQKIIQGDCLHIMQQMESNSIDCILTDPPYGLSFMNKDWDKKLPSKEIWQEALRVCKPGAPMLCFGGSRTYHRLACLIEDSGWEIRDCIFWCFGQGFPKSHNFGCKCTRVTVPYIHENISGMSNLQETISEGKMLVQEDQESLLHLQLQRERESEIFSEIQQQRKGEKESWERSENGKELCLERGSDIQTKQRELPGTQVCEMSSTIHGNVEKGRLCNGTPSNNGTTFKPNSSESRGGSSQRPQHKEQCNRKSGTFREQSGSQDRRGQTCETCKGIIGFDGYGTALKPAFEPVLLTMKPCEGTFSFNAEKWGVAGLNIDECRIETDENTGRVKGPDGNCYGHYNAITTQTHSKGRWPSNIILDEEAAELLDQMSGLSKSTKSKICDNRYITNEPKNALSIKSDHKPENTHNDSGGASRFFYCAKASTSERGKDNRHPTVKPIKLLEYLLKLIFPPNPNAVVLDPFCGSGSTLVAASKLGFNAIGIEISAEYCEIANKRVEHATNGRLTL